MNRQSPILLIFLGLITTEVAIAEDGWRPNAEQAAAIGTICQGWRQIAGGIYLLKAGGHTRPVPKSPLEKKVIDEIYSPQSSVITQGMAESMGEQYCIPVVKEKFRIGELRVKG